MTEIPSLSIAEADPKPWHQSQAMLGGLLVVVSQSLGLACLALPAAAPVVPVLFMLGLLGGLLALRGRVLAEQPIARRLL